MRKFLLLAILALVSCSAPKNLIYFSDAERFKENPILQNYENKIQKDDLLSITISSKSPELTIPFNTNPSIVTSSSTQPTESVLQAGYLVNSEGDIVFPILGKLHVAGLTNIQLANLIQSSIIEGGYINDPIATVKLLNYKIYIMGEVKLPGMKKVETERVTILEAISMAGDLTIFGKRDNISIIREVNGVREIAAVDVSNKAIFESPYYYLQPNDVIYVEPNKKQQRQSINNPYIWPTVVSGLSFMATILNILIR